MKFVLLLVLCLRCLSLSVRTAWIEIMEEPAVINPKEVAVRKVVGARVGDIIRMFFREYTVQVMLAGAVALPLAYIAMSRWLQGYAYRTDIPWWLLAGVRTGVVAVVLLTVLWQVLRAANSNPAEVVKSE